MKQFIRITIALVMGIIAFGFQSCGNDEKDEPESKVYATAVEIQGSWHGTLNGFYYRFTFDDDNYTYAQMSISGSEIVNRSSGTFSISGHKILFSGGKNEVPWSDEEIYWSNSMKNYLQIGKYLSLMAGD